MPVLLFSRRHAAAGLFIASLATLPIYADTLNGTAITGTLTSSSSAILVTKPFQPTATIIGSGAEFTGSVYVTALNLNTTYNLIADFTDTQFILHISSGKATDNITSSGNLYTLQFTNTTFAGLQLPFTAYTCSGSAVCYSYAQEQNFVSSGISGSTFTASFKDLRGDETYTFGTLAATTPEPSSLVLLGTGTLGAFAALKRRVSAFRLTSK